MAHVGITVTEPRGLPFPPFPQQLSMLPHVQLLPKGHDGAQPILHIRRTVLQSAEIKTPVKPEPESPPLVVNIVTVCPIYLYISSTRELTQLSIIIASLMNFGVGIAF